MLRDIGPDGTVTSVTGGWLRASLREIDPDHSRAGAPVVPCRNPQAVPVGEPVDYRIPLVPNARRFAAGHRIQLMITSDDQPNRRPTPLSPADTRGWQSPGHARSGVEAGRPAPTQWCRAAAVVAPRQEEQG
jgi:predicted acyl esterase